MERDRVGSHRPISNRRARNRGSAVRRDASLPSFFDDTTEGVPPMRTNGLNRRRAWGLGPRGQSRSAVPQGNALPPRVSARVGCAALEAAVGIGPDDGGASRVTSDVRDRSRSGKAPPAAHRASARGVGTATQRREPCRRTIRESDRSVRRSKSIEAGAFYRAPPPRFPDRANGGDLAGASSTATKAPRRARVRRHADDVARRGRLVNGSAPAWFIHHEQAMRRRRRIGRPVRLRPFCSQG